MGEKSAASRPDVESFITRWTAREGGAERANYQMFLTELCDLIGVEKPQVSGADTERNDYVFERAVRFQHDDSSNSVGRIDLYKKSSFVLEAKQSRIKGAKKEIAGPEDLFSADTSDDSRGRRGADRAWDVLMLNAKRQAEEYARALPTSHGWPPFVLVADVGHCIEVYADFSGQGKNYTQFPDRQGFRIFMEDLRKDEVRKRLHAIWKEPQTLDPTRVAAKATREIAERLAAVSKALEAKKYPAEEVAHFLMRCLFTMFAEDVRLLPENSFRELLADCRNNPGSFVPLLTDLWRAMNDGEYAVSIRTKVLKFNGNLFADAKVLPLGREEIGELAEAANKNWKEVEPAIFGTLLEQALDPTERRRLGAHYTPRAYVERLVIATIIEPLREDWRNVQTTAETLRSSGDNKGAIAAVKAFHDTLCETRVLDPACGTGNFLYVSMELMKKLEGEVLEALLDLGGQEALTGLGGHTVDPHQFLGLEINPRAAAIAELVLWIGYLQAHFRTKGGVPEVPILKAFKNIQVMDAVLTWDGFPLPQVVDGKEAYPNPRRPQWPIAEFIVGNPPFIGGKDIRGRLGDAYGEALWAAHKHINESADLVMYWWDRAAELLTSKGAVLRRFGLVTTNSITQEFSRRVMKKRLEGKHPLSLVMAVNDHPWTKATEEAAQVRIAMTVAQKGQRAGILHEVTSEANLDTDQPEIKFAAREGQVNSDLTVGVDVTTVGSLRANRGIAHKGFQLNGEGFIIPPAMCELLDQSARPYLKRYFIGRDINQRDRNLLVIDLFPQSADHVLEHMPKTYQLLAERVRSERAGNPIPYRRDHWWLFGQPSTELRDATSGLAKVFVTARQGRHRIFSIAPPDVIAESTVVVVAVDDSYVFGVLQSGVHEVFSLKAGGWLGVGNDTRYFHTKTFEPFPFPGPDDSLKAEIRAVAEELDALRKERQRDHPHLTLTQMYNVLQKLKVIEAARTPLPHSPSKTGVTALMLGEGADPGLAPGEAGEGGLSAVCLAKHEPSPGFAPAGAQPPSPARGRGDTAAPAGVQPPSSASERGGASARAAIPSLTEDEERIKDQGLILILKELHERLDALVFRAYGWPETLSDEEILARLVALNHERAAEEKRGLVRWLRPDYQIPRFGKPVDKQAAQEEGAQIVVPLGVEKVQKPSFPTGAVERTAAVFAVLAAATTPLDAATIASGFRQGKRVEKQIAAVLMSLARLGHVAVANGGDKFEIRRAA